MAQKLTIIYKALDSLVPYAKNARTHSDEQIGQIARSITEFGFTNPILADGKNGVIAGHGRLLAAKSLGMSTVPVIDLHGLTAAQKRALILADNRLALSAGWDADLLRLELAAIGELGLDVSLTGFSEEEIAALMAEPVAANSSQSHSRVASSSAAESLYSRLSFLCPSLRAWWQARLF